MKITLNLSDVKIIAESFQAVCIGIGALIAGVAGFVGLTEWREKQESIKRIKEVQKKYPFELFGSKLTIGHTASSGHWYLLDKLSNTAYHIKNLGTLNTRYPIC